MTRPLVFAANWKMNVTPAEARSYAARFLDGFVARPERSYLFFPSAVALETTATALANAQGVGIGVQDIYWEPKGAFTGATSAGLAKAAGASVALVGHSERRHVFAESDGDTNRKVKAALGGGLTVVLCVGELLAEREAGSTEAVVLRQLTAGLAGLSTAQIGAVIVAYEPVWAIGTGKNATPADAAAVHRTLRAELVRLGHPEPVILYGGSVSGTNVAGLVAETEINGVLVGGASLDPAGWRKIVEV